MKDLLTKTFNYPAQDGLSRPISATQIRGVSDTECLKMDGALIRPATDRVQDGDLPPFFTEEALLRLEERLHAQRVQQEGRRFLEQDARSQRAGLPAGESEFQEPANTRFADRTFGLIDRQLEALCKESFDARHHLLAPALARFRAKAKELTRHTRGCERLVANNSNLSLGFGVIVL